MRIESKEIKEEKRMKYPKIQSVYKRDPNNNFKTFLPEYSTPEIEYLKDNTWEFTEKVDGTNIRIEFYPELQRVFYKGRTERSQIPTALLTRLQIFTPALLGGVFDHHITGVTLYGEGYGKWIQHGSKYLPDRVDFILFDVWVDGMWLKRTDVDDIAHKLGIQAVPVITWGTLNDMKILTSFGIQSQVGECPAEGIVARPTIEMCNRKGERIITKLKTKDFK